MKKIILIISFIFFCVNIFSQLSEVTITDPVLKGAHYDGVKYDSGRFALNDPFNYDPNFPTADAPVQGWQSNPKTHCFASHVVNPGAVLAWECDFVIEPGKELFALDLWGRIWLTENGNNGVFISGNETARTQDLYLSITNDTTTWEVPTGEWAGVSSPQSGAYARFIFKTAGVPEEILKNGGHLIIERKNTSKTLFFHIDELRLVASYEPQNLGEVSITNPVFKGANYPGVKYDSGKYALNDNFLYDPADPTASSPLQAWVDGNDTSHCFAQGTASNISWECDFTIESGKELYALDLWGRVWKTLPNGEMLDPQDAVRSQNLHISLTSMDEIHTWEVPGGKWIGPGNPAEGAYGRYVFTTVDVPEEILYNGGHLVIRPTFTSDNFFHIDELRLLSASETNKAPVVSAGEDQVVKGLQLVTLDGTGSTDANSDTLSYSWVSITDPTVVLSNATVVQPTFTAPEVTEETDYLFSLTVNDGEYDSKTDEVIIKIFPSDTNFIPNAVIQADNSVDVGQNISLDGSGSSDFEGDSLQYLWRSLTPGIVLSDTISESITFPAPDVQVDTEFEFSLVVNDGANNSEASTAIVLVNAENNSPVAIAGLNMIVETNGITRLDGTDSYDIDGDELKYQWTASDGSISFSDSSSSNPTIIPSNNGKYTIYLSVSDGEDTSSVSSIEIIVNTAPVADAGSNRKVAGGTEVILDGTGSYDEDGDSISFLWVSKNPSIALSSATDKTPSFTAPPIPGRIYQFGLSVMDSIITGAESIVTIIVNSPPVANAGSNILAFSGDSISLDGTGSYDPDNDQLTYLWVSKTDGSIQLTDSSTVNPGFKAPNVEGVYQFELIVADSMVSSLKSVVEIVITEVITSVSKDASNDSFTIYPNPVKDILTIKNETMVKPYHLEIFNQEGKIVFKQSNNSSNQIDLSGLQKGVYYLRINNINNSITKKLIKQ